MVQFFPTSGPSAVYSLSTHFTPISKEQFPAPPAALAPGAGLGGCTIQGSAFPSGWGHNTSCEAPGGVQVDVPG